MPLSPRRMATRRVALPLSVGVVVAGAVTATVLGIGAGPVAAEPNSGRSSVSAVPTDASAATHRRIRVPDVVGMTESRAQCAVVAAGLRWRYRGDNHVHSAPISDCSAIVMPDPRVTSQRPKADALVRPHRVIVLDDVCLQRVRAGQGPCL